MNHRLEELLVAGDALCRGGDLQSLIHVVAEIGTVATELGRQELVTAREACSRWEQSAMDRRGSLAEALAGQRSNRNALRTYGSVAAA